MTEKQCQMMDVITTHFINKEFYFSDLAPYGDFHAATLTSLVNLGLLKSKPGKGKKLYIYIEPDLSEEEMAQKQVELDLQSQINKAKGIIDHLDRSKASWEKQLGEVGIKLPEVYDEWVNIVYEQTQNYLFSTQDKLLSLYQKESAF